jgi:hypothetical protein
MRQLDTMKKLDWIMQLLQPISYPRIVVCRTASGYILSIDGGQAATVSAPTFEAALDLLEAKVIDDAKCRAKSLENERGDADRLSIRIHPRMYLVRDLERAIADAIHGRLDKSAGELTNWECVQAITKATSDAIGSIAKYEIRIERHGDPDKPGDEA